MTTVITPVLKREEGDRAQFTGHRILEYSWGCIMRSFCSGIGCNSLIRLDFYFRSLQTILCPLLSMALASTLGQVCSSSLSYLSTSELVIDSAILGNYTFFVD